MKNGLSQLTAPIKRFRAVSSRAAINSERAAMIGLLVSSPHQWPGLLCGLASCPYGRENAYEAIRDVLDGYAFLS